MPSVLSKPLMQEHYPDPFNVLPNKDHAEYVFAKWRLFDNKTVIPVLIFEDTIEILSMQRLIQSRNGNINYKKKFYDPALVFSGSPWNDNNYCAHCGVQCSSLKCSKCRLADVSVYYCSRKCQRDDWAVHRSFCFKCPMKRYSLLSMLMDLMPGDIPTDYVSSKMHSIFRDCTEDEESDILDDLDIKAESVQKAMEEHGGMVRCIEVDLP